jgi:hypothetical protein
MSATRNLTEADRKRLASILGMLGSSSASERDNAATLAERLRRQHRLTWSELLEMPAPAPPGLTPAEAAEKWAIVLTAFFVAPCVAYAAFFGEHRG